LAKKSITNADEYNSDNTERLDVKGMKLLLNKLKFIQAASRGEIIDPEE
jgi:UDP-glucose 4-epimerase